MPTTSAVIRRPARKGEFRRLEEEGGEVGGEVESGWLGCTRVAVSRETSSEE